MFFSYTCYRTDYVTQFVGRLHEVSVIFHLRRQSDKRERTMSRPVDTILTQLVDLRRIPNRLRIAALSEAFLVADAGDRALLACELLEIAIRSSEPTVGPVRRFWRLLGSGRRDRAQDAVVRGLAAGWHLLSRDQRGVAATTLSARLRRVLPELVTASDPRWRLGAAAASMDLASGTGATLSAELLDERLDGPEHPVAVMAERALLVHAVRQAAAAGESWVQGDLAAAMGGVAGLQADRADRDQVLGAIAQACQHVPIHRRRGVLVAVAALLNPADLCAAARLASGAPATSGATKLGRWLLDCGAEEQALLRSVLRSTRLPVARLRALQWLTVPGVERAALQRVARAESRTDHEQVLMASHLALRPAREFLLHGLTRRGAQPGPGRGAIPAAAACAGLSRDAKRGLPRWMGAISPPAPERAGVLSALLTCDDVVTRHAAARSAPATALADYVFDSDARVARSAALRWWGAGDRLSGAPARRLVGLLERSQQPYVRAWAAQAAETDGRRALRERWMRSRSDTLLELSRALEADEPAQVQAILDLRRLEAADQAAPRLAVIAEHGSPRAAATAAAALADVRPEAVTDVMPRLLTHADARVRANAVEAAARIAMRGGELPQVTIELKEDSHHRVRANALRAWGMLASVTDALDGLRRMLADDRAMHRLAAVWLAPRLMKSGAAPADLRGRIMELASYESDERVRQRAAALAACLAGELRGEWSNRLDGRGGSGLDPAPARSAPSLRLVEDAA